MRFYLNNKRISKDFFVNYLFGLNFSNVEFFYLTNQVKIDKKDISNYSFITKKNNNIYINK